MNQTSSVITGLGTVSAATLSPLVSWALGGFPQPVPESVPYLIAAAILTVGHALYNIAISRQQNSAPPASSQSGRALPILLLIMAGVAMSVLTGCASLQNAGTAEYSVKPFVIDAKAGTVACCEVMVRNGKEIASVKAHVQKQGDSYTVDLEEQGVQAFQGQTIAAGVTQAAIDAAAKAAVAAALAPVLPALLPAAGAALQSGGLSAAAVGAGAVIVKDKVQP